MNKVMLQGRLTKDPEIKYTQSSNPTMIANFNLAVNRRYKREGEPDADFIPIIAFGKIAELIEKYVKRGNQIIIAGRLQIRSYDDDNGQRRWVTNVVAEEVYFCGSKNQNNQRDDVPPEVTGDGFVPVNDEDDLPF